MSKAMRKWDTQKKKHGPSLLSEEITIQLKQWPVSNTKRNSCLGLGRELV